MEISTTATTPTTQLYTPNGPAVSAEANLEVTSVPSICYTVSASFMMMNKRYIPSISKATTTIIHGTAASTPTTHPYTQNGPAVSAEANFEVTPVFSAYSTVSASFMVMNKRYKPSVSMATTTIIEVNVTAASTPPTQPPSSHTPRMAQLSRLK